MARDLMSHKLPLHKSTGKSLEEMALDYLDARYPDKARAIMNKMAGIYGKNKANQAVQSMRNTLKMIDPIYDPWGGSTTKSVYWSPTLRNRKGNQPSIIVLDEYADIETESFSKVLKDAKP